MPRKATFYIYSLGVLTVPLLLYFGHQLDPNWVMLMGLVGTNVAFSLLSVEAPTGQNISLTSAVKVTSVVLGGPALGVWVAAIGELLTAMLQGYDSKRTTFNTAQMVITVAVSGSVFRLLGGQADLGSYGLLAAAVLLLVYLLVNSLLVAILYALIHNRPPLSVWNGMLRDGVESYLVVQGIGLVATFVIDRGGWAWSLVLLALLYIMQRVMSKYYSFLRRDVESTRKQAVQSSLLGALVAALDARDVFTSGHSTRVADYADLIGQELGLSDEQRDDLRYASLLHDVGKIGIPDAVLQKDGPLTPAERSIMMEHPVRGVEILSSVVNVPERVLLAVRHHHEWFNGGGYPDSIAGDQIPLEARIISVADALDAMTSSRPYRDGMEWQEALRRLFQGRSTQFDPAVVDAMLRVSQRSPELQQQLRERNRPEPSRYEGILAQERTVQGQILPAHSKEIKILYHLATDRRFSLNLNQTLLHTVETLHDLVGKHAYYMMLLTEDGRELVVRAAAGISENIVGTTRGALDPVLKQVLDTGEIAVFSNLEERIDVMPFCSRAKSMLLVPLLSNGRTIGILGAETYQTTPFGTEEAYVLAAVARQVADTIEVARAHERMTHAATHDGLTGLKNRSSYYRLLDEELSKATIAGYPLSVAILDLNDFKQINDTFGHLAGDRTVVTFASHLTANLRPFDLVARYGGDEFAVIMPKTRLDEAEQLINRICGTAPSTLKHAGHLIALPTPAWGVAAHNGTTSAEELVAEADQRMYACKQANKRKKGRVVALPS